MIPFVNIHTHQQPKAPNEIILRNVMLHKVNSMPQVNYPISIGLHPWFINQMPIDSIADQLLAYAMHKQVWAIGEIGIDRAAQIDFTQQQKIFDVQLNVARALQKPVIIHAVRSHNNLLPYIKKYNIPFIIHGFIGNMQQANDYVRHGAYLSFGAALLQSKVQEVFAKLPLAQCLLETDTSNLPIADIYLAASQAKNISLDELKAQLFTTFASIFKK